MPELGDPLSLRAKVMWTTPPSAATKVHPAGMGIRFQFQDAAEQARTEDLIERLLASHLGERHTRRLLGKP